MRSYILALGFLLSAFVGASERFYQQPDDEFGTPDTYAVIDENTTNKELQEIGKEDFILRNNGNNLLITANTEVGLLYGSNLFKFTHLRRSGKAAQIIAILHEYQRALHAG